MYESTEHRLSELRSLLYHKAITQRQYDEMTVKVLDDEEELVRFELRLEASKKGVA